MESKKIVLTMITGNKKKLEEFLSIMSDELAHHYTVVNKEIDRKKPFDFIQFIVDEL